MADSWSFGDDLLAVTVGAKGAELLSLRDARGREWLWQGDEASWPRQAPMLFPVVGRCANGILRHQGHDYPMPRGHGYAPERAFSLVSSTAASCRWRLDPDAETRRCYPFDMRLDVTFSVADGILTQRAEVTNVGTGTGVASVGFHPGFQWPTPNDPGGAQDAYVVRFEKDEPAPIRRIVDGRLTRATFSNELDGRTLHLHPGLFAVDAMVFDAVRSRSVWFGRPGLGGVRADFPDCPHLGLWMRPGAPYLCIEPWQGHHCPEGFDGDITDKPGMIRLEPGEGFVRTMVISIDAPEPV
ncbi:aldose 1-epimerase family protein [Alsobacter sp. R-9]